MRIPRLYCPANFAAGQTLTLSKEQAHYVLTVLRLKNERLIELFDGKGNQASGKLIITSRRTADVVIDATAEINTEPPLETILVQGISKGDRMDYTIQKTVELGINQIQPIFTEYCDVKLNGDKLEKKLQQWQDIAINACEQSNRNVVPKIMKAASYEAWLNNHSQINGLVLNPYAETSLKSLPTALAEAPIHLLIGPEGGLTDSEVKLAIEKGMTDTRLGPRILRTETAGVAVLSALQTLWGDF